MIDITTQNLQTELLQASMQQPVLLDIWAPWCGPCRSLGPMLEKLEVTYAGRFKLAKLNSDEQPEIAGQLSQMFGVRSIPFCVLFDKGQPVDGFVGALPESEIRAFLDKHVPSPDELEAEAEIEEAQELLDEGDADAALAKLSHAVQADPENDGARVDLIQLLLDHGQVAQARSVFNEVANRYGLAARLVAVGHHISAHEVCEAAANLQNLQAELHAAITANKRDFAARLTLAQTLWAQGQHTQAMDELLEIIMRDKSWSEELARKTYVAILELMSKPAAKVVEPAATKGALELTGTAAIPAAPSDPVLDQYRRKLSMALF